MARSLSDQPETLLFLPAEPLALAEELATDAPALETPVLLPVDLSRSHGHDITAGRIEELAASYDPHVESATLNFDHAWGGRPTAPARASGSRTACYGRATSTWRRKRSRESGQADTPAARWRSLSNIR